MIQSVEPAILYAGTPVVLISTRNEDGSINIAPMSSAWWLGWSCMIGLDATSKTTENLIRERECVLNLASTSNIAGVDALALLTGREKVPIHKKALGYKAEPGKLEASGFTSIESMNVAPPRVTECPIQMEARVIEDRPFGTQDPKLGVPTRSFELVIERIHAHDDILDTDHSNRIDPDKWRPLLMSFRQFYGLGEKVASSRLAEGAEEKYAPWKKGGLKGAMTRAALKVANRKYS